MAAGELRLTDLDASSDLTISVSQPVLTGRQARTNDLDLRVVYEGTGEIEPSEDLLSEFREYGPGSSYGVGDVSGATWRGVLTLGEIPGLVSLVCFSSKALLLQEGDNISFLEWDDCFAGRILKME